MRVALNMIVKNEVANLSRCLASVVPYISSYVIVDTGSDDGTPSFIKKFMDRCGIPGEIHHAPFVDFSQARNFALDCANQSAINWDYLLLCDADMELKVNDDHPFSNLSATALCLLQKHGGLSYYNTRVVRRGSGARYFGVTHEYLSVDGLITFDGAWFLDHATGSNRVDKFARDIRLLLADLEQNPSNGRSWFYLAQSYRDAGQLPAAVDAYRKNIALSGWDEEVFIARLELARCLKKQGLEAEFVSEMLAAYNHRPIRAEPLLALANHYREKPNHANLGVLFAEAGMKIPRPNDLLFVEDFAYTSGCREEFSICAFYDPQRRARGFRVCNDLALDTSVSGATRELARSNLFHYLPKLVSLAPSFKPQVQLESGSPWKCLNPSVTVHEGKLVCILRTVNYTITESGHYDMHGDTAIRTHNNVLVLSDTFKVLGHIDIKSPPMPVPLYDQVLGFEDMRAFSHNGELLFSACMRELNPGGWCEQVFGAIDPESGHMLFYKPMRPSERRHEKNWSPFVQDEQRIQFLYRPGSLVDVEGIITQVTTPPFALDSFSGSSQLIQFDGGWLALMHEAAPRPDGKRYYRHRFVWFDYQHNVSAISLPFAFHEPGTIEFAAGLTRHPTSDDLVVSYGVKDCEAWLGTLSAHDVRDMLWVK